MRSVRPPRMLPAGAFVGTGCPGGGIGTAGADAGAELPLNSLPRISAPTATAIGVARLPPGTAFLIASSKEAIVVSSTSIQIARNPILRLQPSAAIRRYDDQDYRLAFSPSIPHILPATDGAREAKTMGILSWIILGLIAGFIASKIVNKTGSGMTMDIALGVIGAIVGGFLASFLGIGGVTGVNIGSIIIAVIGAVVVLLVYRAVASRA